MTDLAKVELVRSIHAALESVDWTLLSAEERFARSADLFDPEIELVIVDGPEPHSSTGVDALVRWREDVLSAWEGYRLTAEEYRELDDERVLVVYRRSGRGKTSGIDVAEMAEKGAAVFHVRDAKVARFVAYWYLDRALADLGLNPEGRSP
jgi:ketosteroid isomerase-like protein